ncbi:winged helix-turn-helix domain-containing protein [Inquilinus sp. Marseille-Q2685]|uniref:winged helix-turn-helix domain-containing protein n=1 Tax=Inquilinus sp. Marseille-Q2685 TaxID=2866581 RepID=UPI001CE44A02|nr:winged helix-turn-helix domain-containing protein [Inquilinus sp. Marseille-Q2685]
MIDSSPAVLSPAARLAAASWAQAEFDMPSAGTDMGSVNNRLIRVLVADDDPEMRATIVDFLARHGVRAITVAGRQDLTRRLAECSHDLVILDLQFGKKNDLTLLPEIRSKYEGLAIIGTGRGKDEIDRVLGLELGADDYLAKPFGLRELLARIRAILRGRYGRRASQPRGTGRGSYRFAGWRLDRRLRRLTNPLGAVVALSKCEYALLVAFVEAPQRVLSREQLLQATRVHEDVFDRSIDVQVLRLRRKLEIDPGNPKLLRTERGVGYVFTAAVEVL